MSAGNLAKALHDELCEAFECQERIADFEVAGHRVAQYDHRYPREFWEGLAQGVVADLTPLKARRIVAERL